MRTTIDIDDRALARARAKADLEGISLGRAVSELILDTAGEVTIPAGFPLFHATGGTPFTDELVARYRDDW